MAAECRSGGGVQKCSRYGVVLEECSRVQEWRRSDGECRRVQEWRRSAEVLEVWRSAAGVQ